MSRRKRHNGEKRAWRGKSHRKGGKRIRELKEKELKISVTYGEDKVS
jgi:hypothetical protein